VNPAGETAPASPESQDDSPRQSKRSKLRKEEIVAEATRLFAERGYEGTSMGDLAERVGLRKASLFHHFE
jgi:AcrR family transcriptional regulator